MVWERGGTECHGSIPLARVGSVFVFGMSNSDEWNGYMLVFGSRDAMEWNCSSHLIRLTHTESDFDRKTNECSEHFDYID